jgi:2C-methyl-D-erythritol 2,4-cyclodiphosphate synthase
MNILERSAPQLPENARSAKNPCEGTAMDLADLIEPGRVVYAGRASNKEQLLQDLASRAATLLKLDAQTICNALQAREELGSTGLGDGFALPHARIEGLDRLFGMFTRLNRLANFGKEAKPEPILANISQETLADMIGTTRSRVSFFMNKFRKLGFIDYKRGIEVRSSLLNVVCTTIRISRFKPAHYAAPGCG